jgi:putative PIN family toxin of toxin-antitoxin system
MKRFHVVLDTNVLVSALIFGGSPREILEMIVAGVVDCSLSSAVLDELRDVLQRPKFGFSLRQAMSVVDELCGVCQVVKPRKKVGVVKADPDGNRVIECALEAKADFIVTGDTHLLELGSHAGTRVLNPADFLRMLGEDT